MRATSFSVHAQFSEPSMDMGVNATRIPKPLLLVYPFLKLCGCVAVHLFPLFLSCSPSWPIRFAKKFGTSLLHIPYRACRTKCRAYSWSPIINAYLVMSWTEPCQDQALAPCSAREFPTFIVVILFTIFLFYIHELSLTHYATSISEKYKNFTFDSFPPHLLWDFLHSRSFSQSANC